MRIDVAPFAFGHHRYALADQYQYCDRHHKTQALQRAHLAQLRRLPLEAVGLVVQKRFFDGEPTPILVQGFVIGRLIADDDPRLFGALFPTDRKMNR